MSPTEVRVDDVGVRQQLADGKVEQVTWDDLLEVAILTTRAGPFAEDLFFVLTGHADGGCVVSLGATKGNSLLERLLRLPGFDNGAVSRAMASTGNEKFVCWRR
jgi:hypothetical protein